MWLHQRPPVTNRYQLWLCISDKSVDYSSFQNKEVPLYMLGKQIQELPQSSKHEKVLPSPITCGFNIISQLTSFIEPHLIMQVTIGIVVKHKLDLSSKTFLIRKKMPFSF